MNNEKCAIICDSGTDTPEEFCRIHDVRVVPLGITYSDGSFFQAGVDITTSQIIERFDEEIPTTSLPSPETILETFRKAKADGYEKAVFVSISSGLSATFQTAKLMAEQMEDFPIVCIDTRSIGAAAGLVVMAAAEMVEAGVAFQDLEGRLNRLSTFTKVFFTVKDLKYLRKGGRIDEFTYRVGSVLNIKPIIWCDADGFYRTYKKARGWKRALKQEFNCISELASQHMKVRVAIACTDTCNVFSMVEEWISENLSNVVEVVRAGFSPALIVHTGPDTVGMAIQPIWDTVE